MAEAFAEIVRAVLDALAGGEAVVTATVIAAPESAGVRVGDKLAVRRDGSTIGRLDGGPLEETVRALAHAAFSEHSAGSVFVLPDGGQVRRGDSEFSSAAQILIETVEAPATLLVVGAGHIGRSLAKIGAETGFSVAVLDDRPDYASPELIPEADQVICADFEEALSRFPINENTSIVMVTRGHKQDELSLRATVTSRAAYIGMIGSRRRTAAVLQHLADEGFPQPALDRVHTPIGLDIGAETPEEIAVSIIAEIIMVRRGGSGGSMYYRRKAAAAEPAAGGD
jgi:xanthine dehydrogenase accessory factor